MQYRKQEEPKLWFRSDRCFLSNGRWYFHTREGFAVGPYETRFAAEVDVGLLSDLLRHTPVDQVPTVTRDFIMYTGGELDYVNDPAFSAYLVSDDNSLLDERRA